MSRFARSYAEAFLQAAATGYDAMRFLDQAGAVARAISARPRLKAFLLAPAVPLEAKEKLLDELAAKAEVDDYGRRFLGVVLRNRRIAHLDEILSALREAADRRQGVVAARVRLAAPAGEAQRRAIEEGLSRQLGRKVRMQVEVDPAILGGFVARVGSEVLDASVAHAIERFQEQAKTGA
jgi:F-type H+-transporting ATPase subunit delta